MREYLQPSQFFSKHKSEHWTTAIYFFVIFSLVEVFFSLIIKDNSDITLFTFNAIKSAFIVFINNIILLILLGSLMSFFFIITKQKDIVEIFRVLLYTQLYFSIFQIVSFFFQIFVFQSLFTFYHRSFILTWNLYQILGLVILMYIIIIGINEFTGVSQNKVLLSMVVPYCIFIIFYLNDIGLVLYLHSLISS